MKNNWHNIPKALQDNCSFGVWVLRADGTKDICRAPATGMRFKPNEPAMTYSAAMQFAHRLQTVAENTQSGDQYLPLLLTTCFGADFQYFAVDLDTYKGNAEVHHQLLRESPTWTETSASGRGYHMLFATPADAPVPCYSDSTMHMDVRGTHGFLFMTGNVVRDGGILFAPEMGGQLAEYLLGRKEYQRTDVNWLDEPMRTDEEFSEYYSSTYPTALDYLKTDQPQGSEYGPITLGNRTFNDRGEARFSALMDLIHCSYNYDQVYRAYSSLPATQRHNASPNKKTHARSDASWDAFIRMEIDSAAKQMITKGTWTPGVVVDLAALINNSRPAPVVPISESVSEQYPPLPGMLGQLDQALRKIDDMSVGISAAGTLCVLSAMCGANYYTATIDRIKGHDGKYAYAPKDNLVFVGTDFIVGAASRKGKSAAFNRWSKVRGAASDSALHQWLSRNLPMHTAKSNSSTVLHAELVARPGTGVCIGMDEFHAHLSSTSKEAGLLNWIKTAYDNRGVGRSVPAPKARDQTMNATNAGFSMYCNGILESLVKQLDGDLASDGFMSRFVVIFDTSEPETFTDEVASVTGINFSRKPSAQQASNMPQHILDRLEAIVAPRKEPVLVDFDTSVEDHALLTNLISLSYCDSPEYADTFNRWHEHAIRLSAVLAIINDPYEPRHTAETLEWSIKFLSVAKEVALNTFRRSGKSTTVERTGKKEVVVGMAARKLYQIIAAYVRAQSESAGAFWDRIERIRAKEKIRPGEKDLLAALPHLMVPRSYINSFYMQQIVGRQGSTYDMKRVVDEAASLGWINVVVDPGGKEAYQIAVESLPD